MSPYERPLCVDCGVNCIDINEYYMVTDACWSRANMETEQGYLCIGCLEIRLGKQLQARNFTDCPLNWRNVCIPGHASLRLVARLVGSPRSKWRKGLRDILDAALGGDTSMFTAKTLVVMDGGEGFA